MRGKIEKCIVTGVVIPALLKLVSRDVDGKASSLSEEFGLILEEDGIYKTYSLYKECRFAKLGYSAGSIYDCLPQFQKLLDRTAKNNLLIRACKLYLESDFIVESLKVLSNFTYYVTMPFLNCVEHNDQNQLIELLPKLFADLKAGVLVSAALKDLYVPWTHVAMDKQKLVSELDHYLMKMMCQAAAEGLELQCSREYWSETDEGRRASALNKLAPAELEDLPTENLNVERYLAKFGNIASVSAKHSNRYFKAKRIRDDLVLDYSEQTNVNSVTVRKLYKLLDQMEEKWTAEQKRVQKQRIQQSLAKSKRAN